MSATMFAPAYREVPVVFPAGEESIYGILVEPSRAARDLAVILLTGGGFIPMMHRNWMWVRLARRLAAEGFPVLRFDYHGVGESTGVIDELWLDQPFVDDLMGAVGVLRDRHVANLVLVGTCFGARTVLGTAERIPELRGAVLLSTPLRGHRMGEYAATRFASEMTLVDYLRRATRLRVVQRLFDAQWRERYVRILKVKFRSSIRPAASSSASPGARDGFHWISRKYLDPLRRLVERRIPLLMLYGAEEEYYGEFQRALDGELGEMLKQAGGLFEVRTVDGVLHSFSTPEAQDAAIRHSFEWICARRYAAAPAHAGSPGAG